MKFTVKKPTHTQPEPEQVVVEPVLVNKSSASILMVDFDRHMPRLLTDILHAWALCKNPWATSIEIAVRINRMGFYFDHEIDELNAVRALYYLGYMDKKEPTTSDSVPVWRYRLTAKGLKAIKAARDLYLNEITPHTMMDDGSIVPELDADCDKCKGSGEYRGKLCTVCNGDGTIKIIGSKPKTEPEQVNSSPEKKAGRPFSVKSVKTVEQENNKQAERLQSSIKVFNRVAAKTPNNPVKNFAKELTTPVTCPACKGTGEGRRSGLLCGKCQGEGEVLSSEAKSFVEQMDKVFPTKKPVNFRGGKK